MGLGGAEKALVSLLNSIDYSKYDIDLQLYNGKGFNLQFIPSNVNVLNPISENNEYYKRFKPLIKDQLSKGRIDVVLRRLLFGMASVFAKNDVEAKYYQWRFVRKYIQNNPKKYDIAIGYLDGTPHYYVIDKVSADKKICWIHNDYSKMPTCKKDYNYLKKADKVVTISPKCVEEVKHYFPKLREVDLAYNINSPTLINQLANMFYPEEYQDCNSFKILSIGRLCEQKAYHFAVKAAKILKEKGHDFQWFIIGDGELKEELLHLIKSENVNDCIHLLGLKENPYPYIKNCDLVVQCSIYEGKSIALDEAKILHRPIVCTDYNSARDQVIDQVEGLIVPISENGVAEGIEQLMSDSSIVLAIKENLSKEDYLQNEYLDKYESIFNGD